MQVLFSLLPRLGVASDPFLVRMGLKVVRERRYRGGILVRTLLTL